jgi:S1-C subfamily serine protease
MTSADPLLLATARVSTFLGPLLQTNASGFFFERDERLYLVTSRHVVIDAPNKHLPDRIEIELHLTRSTGFSIPLYADARSVWRQGRDSGGEVDIAVLELDRTKLPAACALRAFTPAQLARPEDDIGVGASLLVSGFPLGFHDALHHLPVVRQAIVASSYGIRFQGQGYFLTDARMHRGASGAPVVMRDRATPARNPALPWLLLGVHSARLDMGDRDQVLDESLGLNCAWYADILMTLTGPQPAAADLAPVAPPPAG